MMLGYWFLIQLVSGSLSRLDAGVAFWAHVGGFAAGAALLALPFAQPRTCAISPRCSRALPRGSCPAAVTGLEPSGPMLRRKASPPGAGRDERRRAAADRRARSRTRCAGCCTERAPHGGCSSPPAFAASRPRSALAVLLLCAASQAALFATSALYHSLPWRPRWKRRMQRADHAMIHVKIAGTITALSGSRCPRPGRRLAAGAWALAAAGVAHKTCFGEPCVRHSIRLQLGHALLGLPAAAAFAWQAPPAHARCSSAAGSPTSRARSASHAAADALAARVLVPRGVPPADPRGQRGALRAPRAHARPLARPPAHSTPAVRLVASPARAATLFPISAAAGPG